MPDLISHIASGYLARPNYRQRQWMFIFLFGTILPDIATRPIYILFPKSYWFVKPMHTPAGIFLMCLMLSGLFAPALRNKVLWHLLGGSALHLFVDLFQKHLQGGYPLAFPFTWRTFEFGLFWPEQMLWFIPLWVCGAAVVIVRKHRKNAAEAKSRQKNAKAVAPAAFLDD